MQRLWGFGLVLSAVQAASHTQRVREQPQHVKRTSMIRWCGQGRSRRDSSVPCRLLHETPALKLRVDVGGRVGGPSSQSSRRTLYRREDGLLQFLLLAAAPVDKRVSCLTENHRRKWSVYNVALEMELQMQLRLQLCEIWSSATGTVAARLWPE